MANFRTYTVVGGMPEASCSVSLTRGATLPLLCQLQSELNEQYLWYISKYASGRALQVQSIYDQLPIMLEGGNKRFVLNSIDPKANYRQVCSEILSGSSMPALLSKADIVTEPKSPLLKTARPLQFKLYQSDTGMLMARYPLGVAQAAYLDSKEPNLGGIYENVVATAGLPKIASFTTIRQKSAVKWTLWSTDRMERLFRFEVNSGSYYHAHAALGHVLDTAEYGVRLGIVFSRGQR